MMHINKTNKIIDFLNRLVAKIKVEKIKSYISPLQSFPETRFRKPESDLNLTFHRNCIGVVSLSG